MLSVGDGDRDIALPFFRFHPDPIATGYLRSSTDTCRACGVARGWILQVPFYSLEDVDELCPWCVADGSAAARFDGEFTDSAAVEPIDNPESLDELLHRTPGYSSWQQEAWVCHCNEPCAYVGLLTRAQAIDYANDLKVDLSPTYEWTTDILPALPVRVDRPGELNWFEVHHFRCVVCGRHRAAVNVS